LVARMSKLFAALLIMFVNLYNYFDLVQQNYFQIYIYLFLDTSAKSFFSYTNGIDANNIVICCGLYRFHK